MVYRQPNTQHVQYRYARETLQKALNNVVSKGQKETDGKSKRKKFFKLGSNFR